MTELEYGDWGRMLIGLRLIDGQNNLILECGDFDDVEVKTVKLDSDERIIGIISRTFGQKKCTHFDVKFKIAKFVWIISVSIKVRAKHFFWFIVLYFCQQLISLKINLSLLRPVFELLIITSLRISRKSQPMLTFNFSFKVMIPSDFCLTEKLYVWQMLFGV